MSNYIHNDWQQVLQSEFNADYFQRLQEFLNKEYIEQTIYPSKDKIYQALEWTSYADTKVVILGQDPYHGENQAIGLSFSVAKGCKIPPSLRNIYKELKNDLGYLPVNHGYLKSWADQGVLMLNTVLTVRAHQPNSHKKKGWEQLTDKIIQELSNKGNVIFVLWGNNAKEKISLIDLTKNKVISSAHPSPFSANRGFFGMKPFSKINKLLVEYNKKPINWQLPEKI